MTEHQPSQPLTADYVNATLARAGWRLTVEADPFYAQAVCDRRQFSDLSERVRITGRGHMASGHGTLWRVEVRLPQPDGRGTAASILVAEVERPRLDAALAVALVRVRAAVSLEDLLPPDTLGTAEAVVTRLLGRRVSPTQREQLLSAFCLSGVHRRSRSTSALERLGFLKPADGDGRNRFTTPLGHAVGAYLHRRRADARRHRGRARAPAGWTLVSGAEPREPYLLRSPCERIEIHGRTRDTATRCLWVNLPPARPRSVLSGPADGVATLGRWAARLSSTQLAEMILFRLNVRL